MESATEEKKVDQETVEKTKSKLMQKAAEKKAQKEGSGGAEDIARKRFEENARLQEGQ